MLIDLTNIANSEEKIIHAEVPYKPEVFSSALGEFPIMGKTPVSLEIRNKGNRKLQIAGKMSFEAVIPCSRCLEDVSVRIDMDFEKSVDFYERFLDVKVDNRRRSGNKFVEFYVDNKCIALMNEENLIGHNTKQPL